MDTERFGFRGFQCGLRSCLQGLIGMKRRLVSVPPPTSGPLVSVPDLLSFALNADPHLHCVACWLIKVFAFGDDYVLLKFFWNRTRNGFCGQCSRGFVGASLK